MTVDECKLLMPKWLGQHMYMYGFPVRAQDYSFEGATMIDIYFRHSGVDPKKFGERILYQCSCV